MELVVQAIPNQPEEGTLVTLRVEPPKANADFDYQWTVSGGSLQEEGDQRNAKEVHWDTTGMRAGTYRATVEVTPKVNAPGEPNPKSRGEIEIVVAFRPLTNTDGIALNRTPNPLTGDVALWIVIRRTTEAISFENYQKHMDLVLCGLDPQTGQPAKDWGESARDKHFNKLLPRRCLPYNDTDAYRLLKVATESFLTLNCGVALRPYPFTQDDIKYLDRRDVEGSLGDVQDGWKKYLKNVNGTNGDQTLPYLALVRDKLRDERVKAAIFPVQGKDPRRSEEEFGLPQECVGILLSKFTSPCLLELIWSYWHEQGMLVQTLNAISQRFQNIRAAGDRDPLAGMEIDPLRPLNNLLWSYIQDEQHRLSIVRRAYEYDHHYGLSLQGKAVPSLRSADSRSKFLEAYHNLLSSVRCLLQGRRLHHGQGRWVPGAQCAQGRAPHSEPGRAQPVRRSPLDGAPGDDDPAVAARPAGVPAVPADADDGRLPGAMDGPRRCDEVRAGLDRRLGSALPEPGQVRRADPALDPVRRLERRQRPAPGRELGPVLAAGDPGVHSRLPRRDRRRPDRRRHRHEPGGGSLPPALGAPGQSHRWPATTPADLRFRLRRRTASRGRFPESRRAPGTSRRRRCEEPIHARGRSSSPTSAARPFASGIRIRGHGLSSGPSSGTERFMNGLNHRRTRQ